jgi:hypothetical protein
MEGRHFIFLGLAVMCAPVFLEGCALVFASEAKIDIEAKISFRLEAKKRQDFN